VGKPAVPPIYSFEWALFVLGGVTWAALLVRAGVCHPVTLETTWALALYGTAVVGLRRSPALGQKLRCVAAYGYVLWFYFAVARIAPALGTPLRDAELYALDRMLFGETPAISCRIYTPPWLTELFSAGYLSYLVYLHIALLHALFQPVDYVVRLATPVMWAFATGFVGYLLVPGVGPSVALADAFSMPLAGGPLTRLNDAIVAHGCSVYDVFPSLHVLITCVLLDHDWRFARRRFWFMLVPAVLLVGSTVYLRYHYAVDVLAAAGLFVLLGVERRRPPVPDRAGDCRA
jgi:hypothetical protein